MGIKEQIEQYLVFCGEEKRLSDKTLRAYRSDLEQYGRWSEGKSNPYSQESVHAYMAYLNRQYAPTSAKRKMAAIHAFMLYLYDYGDITINPFDGFRIRIREPKRLPRIVPADELSRLFRHLRGAGSCAPSGNGFLVTRDLAVIELLIATGLRVSELCSLDVGCLDLDGHSLRVLGKGDKERVIHLENEKTLNAIRDYLKCRGEVVSGKMPALFLNRFGNRVSDHAIRDMLQRRGQEAGLSRHVTPHMFRHTFATLLLENDIDIRYIQHLLGHSSLRTTEIYTHVTSAKLRKILRENNPRKMVDA